MYKYILKVEKVTIVKFTNFCAKNFQAPLDIKVNVLDTCIVSSLCYAAETWGDAGKDVETIYRYGIRVALGIRQSVNNEHMNIYRIQ